MRLLSLIFLCFFSLAECRADIKFVDFKKIDPEGRLASQKAFLLDNLVYFDHWSPDWVYEVPKDSLIRGLKSCLTLFEPLRSNVPETYLLLGEIGHYLYNLNEQSYYDTAESWYLKAIAANEKDCRGYWFLGYHYALSAEVKKGAEYFDKAIAKVDAATGNDFWQEYAYTMMLAGLPSHCRQALDKYLHAGGSSMLSKMMDSTLRTKCMPADPDISYSIKALWESEGKGKEVVFLSRPLGMRLVVDSNWKMQMGGFGKRLATVAIQPPVVLSPKGARIGYSIGVVVRAAEAGEQLKDFMASMMKMDLVKDAAFPFAGQYPGGISYTLKDKTIYSDRGGANIHFIGIERQAPSYPGLSLEGAAEDISSEPGKLQFFSLSQVRTRFSGRIFYLFILDTCEDIHAQSWDAFSRMFGSMKLD